MLNIFKKKPKKQEQEKKIYKIPTGTVTDPLIKDIIEAPHTLICGTTGSGKSVLLNNIIYNFLTCKDVNNRLILIDPKRVELYKYSKLPQVLKYCEEPEQVPAILDFVIKNIDYRYKLMRDKGLDFYNGSPIYIVIDELADLMISPQKKEIKTKLQKILQIARAADVHIIACTQAPNRVTIPASIVLNFTNRVALRCLGSIESRQVINQSGAEKLPKYGECLYLSPNTGLTKQKIAKIEDEQIKAVIYKWLHEMEVKKDPVK